MRPRHCCGALCLAAIASCTTKSDPNVKGTESVAHPPASMTSPASAPTTSSTGDSALASPASSTVDYYTAADLDRVAQSLSRGGATGHTLRAHPTYSYLQIRRIANGTPEVHDRWIDVTVVQAGRGTLVTGARVTGSRAEADGEHRGGTIQDAMSRPVGPGDLMVIPAGVPHQYLIQSGDSLRYITTKILSPSR